jgi:hypothetical protein
MILLAVPAKLYSRTGHRSIAWFNSFRLPMHYNLLTPATSPACTASFAGLTFSVGVAIGYT